MCATRARTVQQGTGRAAWGLLQAKGVPLVGSSLPRGTAAVARSLRGAHHHSWTGMGVGGGGVGGPRTWWPFRIRAVRVYCRASACMCVLCHWQVGPETRAVVCGLWAGNVKLAQRWGLRVRVCARALLCTEVLTPAASSCLRGLCSLVVTLGQYTVPCNGCCGGIDGFDIWSQALMTHLSHNTWLLLALCTASRNQQSPQAMPETHSQILPMPDADSHSFLSLPLLSHSVNAGDSQLLQPHKAQARVAHTHVALRTRPVRCWWYLNAINT